MVKYIIVSWTSNKKVPELWVQESKNNVAVGDPFKMKESEIMEEIEKGSKNFFTINTDDDDLTEVYIHGDQLRSVVNDTEVDNMSKLRTIRNLNKKDIPMPS